PICDLRQRRQKLSVARLALRLAGRVCHIAGAMLVEGSATMTWARAVADHRSMEAAPFPAISNIGIRLDPRSGEASSISVAPNGNESSAEAHGSETATTSNASNARQQLMIIGSPKTRRGTHEGCWSEQTLGLDRHGGLRECAWPGQA